MKTPIQVIKEEYAMSSVNPEKKISITISKLAEMMQKYADHVVKNKS